MKSFLFGVTLFLMATTGQAALDCPFDDPNCSPPATNYSCVTRNNSTPLPPSAMPMPFPTLRQACELAPEYDCPLFTNRPYDSLIEALDTMSAAIATTPECSQMKDTLTGVNDSAQSIREALKTLHLFLENPESMKDPLNGQLPVAQLDAQIRIAIESANRLGSIFTSSPLLQSTCGRELMSTGQVMVSLNELVNSLAPYALMAFAANPGVGVAAKFALTGGAAATSAAATFVRLIEQSTVDMGNPVHRTAVLKNTCQFWKIDRKMTYMRLASSQQIDEVTRDLEKQEAQFLSRFSEPSSELQKTIQQRLNLETSLHLIENYAARESHSLKTYEAQLQDARNNPLLACVTGQELLALYNRNIAGQGGSEIPVRFPVMIFTVLSKATELHPLEIPDTRVTTLAAFEAISRRKLTSALSQALNENTSEDSNPIQRCAEITRAWVGSLRQMLSLTTTLTQEARTHFDGEQAEDAEYNQWRTNENDLQQTRRTHQRIVRALHALEADDSAIQRSELEQKHAALKTALFGRPHGFSLGRAPVHEWLEHTLRIFGHRVSSLRGNLKTLRSSSRGLNPAIPETTPLSNMTLETLPLNSRSHVVACRILKNSWLDWSAAIDHLGASEFMCNMIDDVLSNSISSEILRICVGDESFATKPTATSRLQLLKRTLVDPNMAPPLGAKEWAKLISQKMRDLQCPKSPLAVMN